MKKIRTERIGAEIQKELSKIIDMKPEEIEKRLNQKKAFQVEFGQKGTNLTYQDKEKLEKKKGKNWFARFFS